MRWENLGGWIKVEESWFYKTVHVWSVLLTRMLASGGHNFCLPST